MQLKERPANFAGLFLFAFLLILISYPFLSFPFLSFLLTPVVPGITSSSLFLPRLPRLPRLPSLYLLLPRDLRNLIEPCNLFFVDHDVAVKFHFMSNRGEIVFEESLPSVIQFRLEQ